VPYLPLFALALIAAGFFVGRRLSAAAARKLDSAERQRVAEALAPQRKYGALLLLPALGLAVWQRESLALAAIGVIYPVASVIFTGLRLRGVAPPSFLRRYLLAAALSYVPLIVMAALLWQQGHFG
jgi:hypothetical protein